MIPMERRKFSRQSANRLTAFLSVTAGPGASASRRQSRIINVSASGLQIESFEFIEPKTALRLSIDLPGGSPSLLLDAEVVWSRPSEEEKGVYYCGVMFPGLGRDVRSLILGEGFSGR